MHVMPLRLQQHLRLTILSNTKNYRHFQNRKYWTVQIQTTSVQAAKHSWSMITFFKMELMKTQFTLMKRKKKYAEKRMREGIKILRVKLESKKE